MRANWIANKRACTASELADEGIIVGNVAVAEIDGAIARLQADRAAPRQEPLLLALDDPRHEGASANEADEHAHFGAEIRVVLEGDAIYEVRDRNDDQRLEIGLAAGDWIVLPPERYHRFQLDGARVHCQQLFAELKALMPFFRASHDETRTI